MRKLALALLAACSSSNHHVTVTPDAPPDTAPDVAPTSVQLTVFGTPALVAYRDGAGAWKTPTADAQGNYALTVSVDYQVVVACTGSTGTYAELFEAVATDGPKQYVFCNAGAGGMAPTTVAMTGHMVQAGDVWFGDTKSSTTAPWDFTLNVTPGMHDLIAASTAHAMVIRRNQTVSTAGAIPSIDVATEGTAMTPVNLTINGMASGTQLMTGLDLFLQHDSASWNWSTASIYAPPSALLTSSDFQLLFVDAYSQTTAQFADVTFTGTETTFDLPAVLTGVVFGPAKASFGTLPTYDEVTLDLQQSRTSTLVEQSVRATKGWIEATHATSLAFGAMPPGFDATWAIDTTTSYQRMFQASYTQNGVSYGSMAYDTSAVQRAVKRVWFSTVARLRESIRSQQTTPRR